MDKKIPLNTPPERYKQTADNQREYTLGLADKVERGEDITSLDRAWIVGALRGWAQLIPDRPEGKPGPAPKLPPGELAMEYAIMVNLRGIGKGKAKEYLAEKYGVQPESIRKSLKKYGDAALAIVPAK